VNPRQHPPPPERETSGRWSGSSGPSGRIHLDIETDDIEAEVKRLEALGAKRVEFIKRWWVMEAPTGQRFCVVRPQRGALESRANAWSGEG
jgi:hypothetical protein